MIRKILINRILFVILPVLIFITIYFLHKTELDEFKLEFLDMFIFLIIIGIYFSISSIKKALKLKDFRDKIIFEGRTKYPKIMKIDFPFRTRFVEFGIDIGSKEIEVFKGKRKYLTVNKSSEILRFHSFLFKRKIEINDVKFLLLEYHHFYEYTFKGWMSRGQFDNWKWSNTISIVLNSGKIVELISGSLEESVYKSDLRELTENPYGHLPKQKVKNYSGIGEKTVNLLSSELDLKYLIIDYSQGMPMHNITLDTAGRTE
jgi:hypothetical protein